MADREPARGEPETTVERLAAYVASVDSALLARCVGAAPDRVARYAELAGFGDAQALPPSYLAFVRRMGKDDGGLLRDLNIDAGLDALIGLYESVAQFEPESINPELPVVATYVIEGDISLDRREPHREPPVIESTDGQPRGPLAATWEALVMKAAMLYVERRRLPSGHWYSASVDSVTTAVAAIDFPARAAAIIDAFALRHRLPIAWPGDGRHRIAVGEDRSLFAAVDPRSGVLLRAFTADDAFLRVVADELARALGASKGGPLRSVGGVLRGTPQSAA